MLTGKSICPTILLALYLYWVCLSYFVATVNLNVFKWTINFSLWLTRIHSFRFIIFALGVNYRNSEFVILTSYFFSGAWLVGRKGIILLIVGKAFANDGFIFEEIIDLIIFLKLLLLLFHYIIDRKLNFK